MARSRWWSYAISHTRSPSLEHGGPRVIEDIATKRYVLLPWKFFNDARQVAGGVRMVRCVQFLRRRVEFIRWQDESYRRSAGAYFLSWNSWQFLKEKRNSVTRRLIVTNLIVIKLLLCIKLLQYNVIYFCYILLIFCFATGRMNKTVSMRSCRWCIVFSRNLSASCN